MLFVENSKNKVEHIIFIVFGRHSKNERQMIDPNTLLVLKHLALKNNREKTTNSTLAEKLGTSPQTISRRLKDLEKNEYIIRDVNPDGQTINVSKKGYQALKEEHKDYKKIFEKEVGHILKGHVIDGIGEGKYYISQDGYQTQFEEKLGFRAYPGTLNVKLNPESQRKIKKIKQRKGIEITGFKKGERTFGKATCYKASLNSYNCALIIPKRSHYSNEVIEIIAPERLRNKIDNKKVKIEVDI